MSASYYGRPVVKPHVWKPEVPLYFWIGGTAGASAVLAACARAQGDVPLATIAKRVALAGTLVSPVLLISDLGVPRRFANMLRVFKPTSPMNCGSWVLTVFGSAIAGSTLAEMLGRKNTARGLELLAAALGPVLATYTSVLLADTATPVWHEAYRELPFVFASSSVAGAGALATLFGARGDAGTARGLMIAGALGTVVAGHRMERGLGKLLSEPYRIGKAAPLRTAASALSMIGAALGLFGGKSSAVLRCGAALVAAGGITERFAILAAGKQSAQDPKYVVESQRARIEETARPA